MAGHYGKLRPSEIPSTNEDNHIESLILTVWIFCVVTVTIMISTGCSFECCWSAERFGQVHAPQLMPSQHPSQIRSLRKQVSAYYSTYTTIRSLLGAASSCARIGDEGATLLSDALSTECGALVDISLKGNAITDIGVVELLGKE